MAGEESESKAGYSLQAVRDFNKNLFQRYDKNTTSEEEERLRGVADSFLASLGEKREQFLLDSYQAIMIEGLDRSLQVLKSEKARDFFQRLGQETPEELIRQAKEDPATFKSRINSWFETVHQVAQLCAPFAGQPFDYNDPDDCKRTNAKLGGCYASLRVPADSKLGTISTNLGHDIHNLPFFTPALSADLEYIVEELSKGSQEDEEIFKQQLKLIARCCPTLYQGGISMFEAFKAMAEDCYPQAPTDLSQILATIEGETATRIFFHAQSAVPGQPRASRLDYNGEHYDYELADKRCHQEFSLETHIEPALILTGHAPSLHLLFYQLVKNSVGVLKENKDLQERKIVMAAKKIEIETPQGEKQPLIAFELTDTGPGLDLTKILRAKQRLLQKKKGALSEKEKQITDQWAMLDLTLVEVVNFIFERRISGKERETAASGIGLSLAKQIIDLHGGCIWATNRVAQDGVKFLIIFDPTEDGSLRRNLPELFRQGPDGKVPAELLNSIDEKLLA